MATPIEGVVNTPAQTRNGKTKNATAGQQEQTNRSENQESTVEAAHTLELSPESISRAQKIVTGSGYITSGDLDDIDYTDEQALELSNKVARQLENLAGGLIQPPSAELAGMVG